MNENTLNIFLGFIILAIVIVASSLFTVYQTQDALIVRLGQLVQNDEGTAAEVYGPGLHVKIPFIDKVFRFENRIYTLVFQSERIITQEQKELRVDLYVQWKISDKEQYYKATTGDQFIAEGLLKKVIFDDLRSKFGQMTIADVVATRRQDIMAEVTESASKGVKNYGISIIDVRIKRIELPEDVTDAVFERMRTARQSVAAELRSKGIADANKMRAEAEKSVKITIATANKTAQQIKGQGDAEAIEIYANTYSQSPEFYEFYRTMEAYRNVFNSSGDTLVLKPEGEFFKYFGKTN